jgi:hypothetical protein
MSSKPITASTTAVAAENALSTTIDEEVVILQQEAGEYYGLNEVATFIWELLEEPQTINEICEAVTTEYDVTHERCKPDVTTMLAELAEKELVTLSEE